MAEKQIDDLTQIKGIGPSRQKWFREVLGVSTFEGLARLSPDIIESGLKAENRIVSRDTIEEWIAEAAEMVAGERLPSNRKGKVPESSLKNNGWLPFASFVVEFQERKIETGSKQRTMVHHMETAEEQTMIHEMEEAAKGKTWPGLESRQLCEWMVGRLDTKIRESTSVEQSTEKITAGTVSSLRAEVKRIHIFQPQETDMPISVSEGDMPFARPVRGCEPLTLEAIFSLDVQGAEEVSVPPTNYEVRFYIKNMATGKKRQLGDICKGILAQREASCRMDLDGSSMPPGIYQLTTMVTLPSDPGSAGYLESSQLQVT